MKMDNMYIKRLERRNQEVWVEGRGKSEAEEVRSLSRGYIQTKNPEQKEKRKRRRVEH